MTTPISPRLQLLLHGPVGSVLWRLSAPNVAAVATMAVVTFADALFVGMLGTTALASLALVFPFQTLMQMMAGGAVGGGTTSAVARALGAGSTERAEAAAWNALAIAVVMAAFYLVVLGVFGRPIFDLLGGSGEALDGAVAYAAVLFGGGVAHWLLFIMAAILRGAGDTATPAKAMIVCSVAQVALSCALTLGLGPFPSLGVVGPAAALVICHGAAGLWLAAYLARGAAPIRLRPERLSRAPFFDIMKVGGIGLVNSVTIAITVVIVTGVIGRYGDAALAGYGLGGRLELMLTPIAFGIGAAMTAAVGANIGAMQFQRARRIAMVGAGVTALATGALGVAVAVFPSIWLDWFTADPAAFAVGVLYFAVVGPFYGFFGGGQSLYFASQGTGRMLLPVLVGLTRLAVVSAVGAMALWFGWPLWTVFAGVAAGLFVTGVGLTATLLGPAWRA